MSAGAEIPPEEICTPCRGTGRLISGLGGEPHEVQCPWCQGSGRRMTGIDAQQAPAEVAPPPAGTPDPGSAEPTSAGTPDDPSAAPES